MKYSLLILLILSFYYSLGQNRNLQTKFEKSGKSETVTYEEGIAYYRSLAQEFPEVTMHEMGITDAGKPLHIVIYSNEREFDLRKIKSADKPILLINNAIHAGEPDGVEASMMLMRDIAEGKILKEERAKFVLVIIPFYNIGGVLNRNSTTRANQNGPVAYGFRGNARNYDLNRDFIKGDTKNAKAFWEIFHLIDPDMFLDTHVSNGADYQYAITLIASQKNKLSKPMQETMGELINPDLYKHMLEAGEPMTPFVNVYGRTPDEGFSEFADWPRYSTGYTALFNTFGFMSETHMLKPFGRRVEATYHLMMGMVKTLVKYSKEIMASREMAKLSVQNGGSFPVKWKLDEEYSSQISFKGYDGSYIDSKVTDQQRLYYDRSKPYEKIIPYKNRYIPSVEVQKPKYYLIPQGWHEVIDRLRANQVELTQLLSDTVIDVHSYRIADFKTIPTAYEGHYFHYEIEIEDKKETLSFKKGDFLIRCDQFANRYIVETLEPLAEDSFFKWNFFDTVLGSKEGFSGYVFEEIAVELLAKDKELNARFRERQQSDKDFASNRYRQLKFIYDQSPHKERSHLQYPVFRIL
ncbi:MAG: M14 family zinc carboxypeptidase [Cyclobacteriaceae bacterium]